jgi:hypothetical protein
MESVGAHLELILEADREILNELREHHGKKPIKYNDEKQDEVETEDESE